MTKDHTYEKEQGKRVFKPVEEDPELRDTELKQIGYKNLRQDDARVYEIQAYHCFEAHRCMYFAGHPDAVGRRVAKALGDERAEHKDQSLDCLDERPRDSLESSGELIRSMMNLEWSAKVS